MLDSVKAHDLQLTAARATQLAAIRESLADGKPVLLCGAPGMDTEQFAAAALRSLGERFDLVDLALEHPSELQYASPTWLKNADWARLDRVRSTAPLIATTSRWREWEGWFVTEIAPIGANSARTLWDTYAREASGSLQPSDEAVVRCLELLEGRPQHLRAVAALLGSMSLETVLEWLETDVPLSILSPWIAPGRPAGIQAGDWALVQQLSVYQGVIPFEAALAIPEGAMPSEHVERLTNLVNGYALTLEEEGYSMPRAVRSEARAALERSGYGNEARARWSGFWTAQVMQATSSGQAVAARAGAIWNIDVKTLLDTLCHQGQAVRFAQLALRLRHRLGTAWINADDRKRYAAMLERGLVLPDGRARLMAALALLNLQYAWKSSEELKGLARQLTELARENQDPINELLGQWHLAVLSTDTTPNTSSIERLEGLSPHQDFKHTLEYHEHLNLQLHVTARSEHPREAVGAALDLLEAWLDGRQPARVPILWGVIEHHLKGNPKFLQLAFLVSRHAQTPALWTRSASVLTRIRREFLLDEGNAPVLPTGSEALVRAVLSGSTNKQIARRFARSEASVRYELSRLYRIAGCGNRSQFARWLVESAGYGRKTQTHGS